MSIVPQNYDNQKDISDSISRFLSDFKLGKLLFRCGAGKEKGIPVMQVFRYLISLMFADRSMYMQLHLGTFKEGFCKNTAYRFLHNPKVNWQKFTALLSARIVNKLLRKLTDEKRVEVYIADDSLYDRSRAKKVELLSKVFDHCTHKYKKGFRLLTLSWSDGSTLLPINSCLLSSTNEKNRYQEQRTVDRRTLAFKRRAQSQSKSNDVLLQLIDQAKAAGHSAKYMLFDSWFAMPVTIQNIKDRGIDTIAMVKKSSRISYGYGDTRLNIKEIYSKNKKRRGRSKYLLSVEVMLGKDNPIPARIVYVRNRSNKKDWLALICTDMSLSEEEIIRIYGRRWGIEVFFKTCKSYLHLTNECHSLSYDSMTAHVAVVFVRYMILAVSKRQNTDYRSLGEIFFFMYDEAKDITFDESMQILLEALFDTILEVFHPSDKQLKEFTVSFITKLPDYMQSALSETKAS